MRIKNSKLKTKIRWLIKALVLVAALWLVFILMPRVLRQIAIAQIAELTNTKIETESVKFNFDGSVSIEKLVVRPLPAAGSNRADRERKYDDAILKAGTVYARFRLGSLLLLQPRLKEIDVNDFVFDARYNLDTGRWNIAAIEIKAPKGNFGKMPIVRLERGTLQYSKVSGEQTKVIVAVPLDARFGPAEETQNGYSFSIATAGRAGLIKSTLTGFWKPGRVTIAGGISSADIPAIERAWSIDVMAAELNYDRNNTYSLKLKVKDLSYTQGVVGDILAFDSQSFLKTWGPFTALRKFFNRYQPAGLCWVDLESSGNLGRLNESTLVGKIHCKDVSILDRKFPYPIEHITGRIDFTEKSISMNNLSGRHNDVKLILSGWFKDFGPNKQYQIRITSNNMALDNDLYSALSTKQKKLWSAFSPRGLAAIDYRTEKQPQTDRKKTLTVELLGAEAVYQRFPYPLKNLTGTLLFDYNGVTISDVVSKYDGREITLNGKVTNTGTDRPIYDISIRAEDVPLDSTLSASLSAEQRYFYDKLDMTGLADAQVKIFTPAENTAPAGFTADVSLKKASLRVPVVSGVEPSNLEAKPLKINQSSVIVTDISAGVVFTPDLIHIENFTGRYGHGSVSLSGRIWPEREDKQPSYCLSLSTEQTELNDDLFSLLPASLKKIVSESQPKGKVNLSADLNGADRDNCPDYKITVDCLGNSVNFRWFAYPLKDITGRLTIEKDSIKLDDITATSADNIQITPNASAIKLNGQIELSDNAFSSGWFTLSANDIFFDKQLGLALPENIQNFYFKLSPTGRFDLNLEHIKIFNTETNEKRIDFAGSVKFRDCTFNTFPPITQIDAALKIKGLYKTGDGFSDSQAALTADSLRIKGKSLTGLKADFNYDYSQRNWLTKNLIADCYGGKLTGKFELKQRANAALEYLLQAGFDNIDLKRFLSDTTQDSELRTQNSKFDDDTSGRMSGSLSVRTAVGDSFSRIGRFKLAISDMKVGKLSPLAKLLSVLKLTEPEHFAFDRMLVDSYIKHNKLLIEQFDLSGKALAFNGSGWLDLQSRNLNLILTARGRRLATAEPSILQSLTDVLGRGVVRMEVTGDFYDPQVTTTTLPVIKETLELLGTKPATPK